jgi:hypothetical protein
MHRERSLEDDRVLIADDSPTHGDNLDQQRVEIEQQLQSVDHIVDSINNIYAQQYLEQNLQPGGQ